jgi:hypothetical protein
MQIVIFASATLGFIVAFFSFVNVYYQKFRDARRAAGAAATAAAAAVIPPADEEGPRWKNHPLRIKIWGLREIFVPIWLPTFPSQEVHRIKIKFWGVRERSVPIRLPTFLVSEFLTKFVLAFVVFPVVAGLIMASVLNGHSYLILGQRGCYASYISGRWGYLDLRLINFRIKLATWLGLTT